jgi:formylglycine-generating enzyme required for sulfatase activity
MLIVTYIFLTLFITSGCYTTTHNTQDDSTEDSTLDNIEEASPCGSCPDGFDCIEGECRWRCQEGSCEKILIPEGSWFVRGSSGPDAFPDAPSQLVWLSEYRIDRFEVTNERYYSCVRAGICPEPIVWSEHLRNPARARYPVGWITFEAAEIYCRWIGGELPTEAQWEKAARGACTFHLPEGCGPEDELKYPWGNTTPTCSEANINFQDIEWPICCAPDCEPEEIGMHPSGASVYGVEDLVGNVSEMIREWYDEDAYSTCPDPCHDPTGPNSGEERIIRGGSSIASGEMEWRVDFRSRIIPNYYDGLLGFRCVYK